MSDNLIIIGFDSEWVAQDKTSNHVLSYQYAVKVGSEMHRGIGEPDTDSGPGTGDGTFDHPLKQPISHE